MGNVASLLRERPRLGAAALFGSVATVVTFLAWRDDVRLSGSIPVLTLGAGLAHAVAGAITGPRILDRARTRTGAQAALVGGLTSLLAAGLFVPPFAFWVSAGNAAPQSLASSLFLTVLVGFFSLLAIGWALCLASALVGWALYRAARKTRAVSSGRLVV